MPPVIVSPFIKIALGMIGAGAAMVLAAKEMRRINEDLDRVRASASVDPAARGALPTLRRDPHTGEWRIV